MLASVVTRGVTAAVLVVSLLGSAQARSVSSSNSGGGGLVLTACESTFTGPGVVDLDCEDFIAGGGNSLAQAQGTLVAFQNAATNVGPGFRLPTLSFTDSLMAVGAGSSNSLFDASFFNDAGTLAGSLVLTQRLDDEFILNLTVVEPGSFQNIVHTGYFFFGPQTPRNAGTEIFFRLPAEFSQAIEISGVSVYTPVTVVPEPAAGWLLAAGLAALLMVRRQRHAQ